MNRISEHFKPASVICPDLWLPFRVFGDQFLSRFMKGIPGILVFVPFRSGNILKEPLYLFFGFKNFSIDVSWIPINEHATQIKYDGFNSIHDITGDLDVGSLSPKPSCNDQGIFKMLFLPLQVKNFRINYISSNRKFVPFLVKTIPVPLTT